jgi:hypothetical protein
MEVWHVHKQQVSGILGDFLADFSGISVKNIPVGVLVPEPSTALAVLAAMATVCGRRLVQRLCRRTRLEPRSIAAETAHEAGTWCRRTRV